MEANSNASTTDLFFDFRSFLSHFAVMKITLIFSKCRLSLCMSIRNFWRWLNLRLFVSCQLTQSRPSNSRSMLFLLICSFQFDLPTPLPMPMLHHTHYYYYYCLYYHSLCWCSFCASAGRKPCT